MSFEFPPVIGGAGIYAHDLAIGFCKNNIQVDILSFNLAGSAGIHNLLAEKYRIRTISFRRDIFFIVHIFFFFLFKVTSQKYDSIILSDLLSKKIFSLLLLIKPKLKQITSTVFHGNEINTLIDKPSILVKVFKIDYLFEKLLFDVRKLIVASEAERLLWINRFPKLKDKFHTVFHGINEDYFFKSKDKERLHQDLGLSRDFKYIVSISRLEKEKGQDLLIDAFALLSFNNSNYKLIIVGTGPCLGVLKSKAKALNLEDKIIFTGPVKRQELFKYYNIAEFFVLISRFIEAFGLVYIEAAACGKTSISGNLGGVTNVVQNKITGLNVDSFNVEEIYKAMHCLVEDNAQLQLLSNNAFRSYQTYFTETIMASNTLSALNE